MNEFNSEQFIIFCEQLDNLIQSQILKAEPRHLLTKKIKIENYFKLNIKLTLFDLNNRSYYISIEVYNSNQDRHVYVDIMDNKLDYKKTSFVLENIDMFGEPIKNFVLFNLDLFND